MVFLTFLAFLQMCILPGLIFVQAFGFKNLGIVKYFSTMFFASVLLNYAVATVFILFGIYNFSALIILMLLEVALVLWNPRKSSPVFYKINLHDNFDFVSLFVFCLIFFVVLRSIANVAPKIFNGWDDVVSWNRWAVSFWQGKIPLDTGHYPQAVPAWWSICYVLCGDALEFLPKACMPLFLFCATASLAESGFEKRRPAHLAASIFILFLFYGTGAVNTGYVDIPVSCTAFFAFVLLLEAIEKSDQKILLLGAVLAVSSSLIKQAGLFAAVGYFIITLMFFKFNANAKIYDGRGPKIFPKNKLQFVVFYASVLILILLPFYGITELNILQGKNGSEISYVTNGIYAGESVPARMLRAFKTFFFNDIKSLRILLLFATPFIFVQKNRAAKSFGIFGIFYWLLWSAFYSYDTRNGFLAWSFIAFSGTVGFFEIAQNLNAQKMSGDYKNFGKIFFTLTKFFAQHLRIFLVACFVLISVFSLGMGLKIDRKFLYDKQELRKNERGGATGTFVENYIAKNGMEGKFLSNFQPLGYMAENSLARAHYSFWFFNSLERNIEKIKNDEIEYLCVDWGDTGNAFKKYFEQKVAAGVFEILFDGGNQVFVHITNREAL